MEKVKIGFIGAGDISYLHGAAVKSHAEAELAGLWNITPELANEKSALFGCKIYESAEALVNDPAIEAVFVLTNLETHLEYATLAMEAGKHVLVEKPVGNSLDEVRQMKTLSEKNNVIFMPGHNYIYEDGLNRTKDLIEKGKLGDITAVYILYNIHHPEEVARRYPGVIRHILTHHSYILLYLGGEPESLSAVTSVIHYEEFDGEDIAMVNFKLKSGGLAHFCASFVADDHAGDPWTFMVKVIGTKGATRYSYRDWVENKPADVHSQTYSAYPYGIQNEVNYFIRNCLGKGLQPLSTIADALVCQKIVEACELSVREERVVHLDE